MTPQLLPYIAEAIWKLGVGSQSRIIWRFRRRIYFVPEFRLASMSLFLSARFLPEIIKQSVGKNTFSTLGLLATALALGTMVNVEWAQASQEMQNARSADRDVAGEPMADSRLARISFGGRDSSQRSSVSRGTSAGKSDVSDETKMLMLTEESSKQEPTISSVRPKSAASGREVRIRGAGFDPSASGNTVTFGGVEATVESAEASVIYAKVPAGPEGLVEVSVTTGGSTTVLASQFAVLTPDRASLDEVGANLPEFGRSASPAWGDYDSDGDLDLAASGKIYQNEGDGTFSAIDAGLPDLFRSSSDWGDYDSDGDLDLAIAGYTGSGAVTKIYRNDGNGTFTEIDAGLIGIGDASLAWGDYDSDGDLDLAVAGKKDDPDPQKQPTTRIYKNGGGDTFTAVGAGLEGIDVDDIYDGSLTWGDYNSDGNLDLAVGGRNPRVYRNDEENSFEVIEAGLSTGPVAWGDYDSDGDLDIADGSEIYRNDGNGDFTPIGAGLAARALNWGDFDGDGDLDIVTATEDRDIEAFASFYENRDGSFVRRDLGLKGVFKPSLASGDYNSDGALDLAITGSTKGSSGITRVYRNFQASPPRHEITSVQPESATPGSAIHIRGAGFDPSASGNTVTIGGMEVAVDSAESDVLHAKVPFEPKGPVEVSVITGDSTASLAGSLSVLQDGKNVLVGDEAVKGGAKGEVEWGDFDQDGNMDFAVSGNYGSGAGSGPKTKIYRNEGDSSFSVIDAGVVGTFRSSLDWGDYDSDGDLDLAVAGFTGGGAVTKIYRNDGNGNFTDIEAGLLGVGEGSVAWGDYDSDGDLDLAVGGETDDVDAGEGSSTRIYRNEGNGTFAPVGAGVEGAGAGVRRGYLDWVDYDSDGDLDLAVWSGAVYRNDGDDQFSRVPLPAGGTMAWADYDSDGDMDLAISTPPPEPILIYRKDRSFTKVASLPFVSASLQWGDHDADGDLDLAVAGEGPGRLPAAGVYLNEDGTFATIESGLTGVEDASVDWADYDSDGDLDLAVAGRDVDESGIIGGVERITKVYRNQATSQKRSLSANSLEPESGVFGSPVQIRGAGFAPKASKNTVTFGGVEATIDSAEANVLYARVPSGLSGLVEVTVTSGEEKDSVTDKFSVLTGGDNSFSELEAGLPGLSEAALDWGDYDSDGDLDLVATGLGLGNTVIYRNEGEGNFSKVDVRLRSAEVGLIGVVAGPDVEWGDYDGDGDLDLAIAGNANGPVTRIYRNDGDEVFKLIKKGRGARFASLSWGDYDSDGDLDLVVTGKLDNVSKSDVYRNDGNDVFTTTNGAGIPAVGRSSVSLGDIDGDSDLDVAVAGDGVSSSTYTIALNEKGTFLVGETDLAGGPVEFVDYDLNGGLDLAAGNEVYRSEADGGLAPIDAGLQGTVTTSGADWGDYDGDGDMDLIVTGGTRGGRPTTELNQNNGGSFTAVDIGLPEVDESDVAWGDFDSDGDLDLALAGKTDRSNGFAPVLKIFENVEIPSPMQVSARSSGGSVEINWLGPDGASIAQHFIYRSDAPIDSSAGPEGIAPLDSVGAGTTSYSDTTGAVETEYYYRVTAVDTAANESGFSEEATATPTDVTPPPVPTGLAATVGGREVNLSWDANTEADLAGYQLYRATSSFSDTTEAEPVTDTLVTRATFTDTGLAAGSEYHYRVAAVDTASNQSSLSGEVVATPEDRAAPSPPPSLAAEAGEEAEAGGIALSWAASDSADVEKYLLHRDTAPIDSSAGPGELAPLDSTEASVTTYSDSSGAAGTEYYYRVTAVDTAANESGFSAQARATPRDTEPPSAPAGLAAQADTTGQGRVRLRWSPPEAADLAGHRLYRSTASFADTSGADRIATLSPTDSVHVDTTATVGETYYYRVAAVDTAANQSGLSGEAVATPEDRAAPSPPPSLVAEAGEKVEAGGVALSWAASDSADVEKYLLHRDTAPIDSSAGPEGIAPLDSVGAGTTSYSDTTGAAGTEYYYRITAVDTAANESGFSEEATATPTDVTPPPVPTGLAATAGGRQVDLSWASGTGGGLAGYRLYRSAQGLPDTSGAPLSERLITGSTFTDTTAEVGTAYRYGVTAVDTAGNESASSGVASAYLQPEAVEASVARTFGEASGPGDYRLVALPGAPDTSLAASVSGEAGAEWQAYREAGDELRRLGESEEEFSFRKGRGYWLTSRQEWMLEGPVESAALKDSTTAIPLNPGGWTIVANPFGEAVPFSALNRANDGDLQALWPFGGAFSDTSAVFKSARQGQAYYLFSEDPGRDSLQVPHPALTDGSGAGSSGKRALQAASAKATSTKAASAVAGGAASATIALSARPAGEGEVGPRAASTVRVGIAGERGPGTLRAPPGGLERVSLRVVRGGQEEGGQGEEKRLLMRDRRRTEGEGETFRLRLESQVEGPIRIQARGADSLGRRSAALIDRSEKTTYDLSRDGPIQIRPGQERRRLEVAVGSESYVEGKREKVIPDEVRLTSYPNPAGRRATVEYALPEAREVTLQVYDVLGRRVATLEQGRKKAGRHTARLETGRLSSGVYFGRLEAGEQTRTQKITVVR